MTKSSFSLISLSTLGIVLGLISIRGYGAPADPEMRTPRTLKRSVEDEVSPPFNAKAAYMNLLARQNKDGSFGVTLDRRYLTTVFVLAALAESAAPASKPLNHSLQAAATYVLSHQNAKGAFIVEGRDHSSVTLLALLAYQNFERAREECLFPLVRPLCEKELRAQQGGREDEILKLADQIYCAPESDFP